MITQQQIQQFLEVGVVTIDSPIAGPQLSAASAALDRLLPFQEPEAGQPTRYRIDRNGGFFDPDLLELLQHPFFEEVARSVLLTENVRLMQSYIVTSYPQPDTPFSFQEHVDIQFRLSDFEAVPRRLICSCFLWLSDVNERRAPLMYRPGSHRLIAEMRERDPGLRGAVPQVLGVSLAQLPPLPFSDPVPLTARAGQVSVLTTGMVHGASVNVDKVPRKVILFHLTAAGVEIGLPPDQAEGMQAYNRALRKHLRPERVHLVAE